MERRTKRLAVVLLALVVFIAPILAAAQTPLATDDSNQREAYGYILTMDKIHQLEQLRSALGLLTEQTANAFQHDDSLTEGTFARRARIIEVKYPEVSAIILKQGMFTREYLVANHVLFHTWVLVEAKRRGDIQHYPEARRVNPANLTLVEMHLKEVRKSMQNFRLRM